MQIRRVSSIRHYLTVEAATNALVCASAISKLDYCNSLLSGCPLYLRGRLQNVQNSAAKLVFKARKRDHVQPLLQALRWLPVQARIDNKLSTICHDFFSDSSHAYFSDFLTVYSQPASYVLLQRFSVSPMLEQKPLANAVSPTVLQSNGNALPSDIHDIQSSHVCLENCVKNSSLRTIPQQVISNSVVLSASPPLLYPQSFLVAFLLCRCAYVCVVRGIKYYDYDIIIISEVLMYTFLCVLLLQSAMCSPLSVRYGTTKMTGIIIIINNAPILP